MHPFFPELARMEHNDHYPKRIVCLTEETVETLYLLGAQDRIVGISGFVIRPRQARKEKPKVSTFIDANFDKILSLEPDLVIGFSDIQAEIAQKLIAMGITVWVNNYRSVQGIFDMMVQLGALVGKSREASELVERIKQKSDTIAAEARNWPVRPKVYFEEWYDPLISGIQWVSELIERAGGDYIFHENARNPLAKDRIIQNPGIVAEKNPDIILVSWCGKKFKPQRMINRKGWDTITAVQNNEIHEINSSIILQPGPAAVTEGLQQIYKIIKNWVERIGMKNIRIFE